MTMSHPTDPSVLSHFQNLVFIARKDGHLDVRELILLHRIAERNHIPLEEADRMIESKGSEEFSLPDQEGARLQHMVNCVATMLADKVLFQSEFNLCVDIARKLAFRDEIVGIIVRAFKDNPTIKDIRSLVLSEYSH